MRKQIEDKTAAAERLMIEAQEAFVMLAKRSVAGEEISPDQIAKLCTSSGKTPADFEQLVLALENRKRLRLKKERLAPSVAAYEAVRAKLEEADRVLEAAVAEHARVTGPLQDEVVKLRNDVNAFHGIDADLVATCPCPNLQAKRKSIIRSGAPDDSSLLREMIEF